MLEGEKEYKVTVTRRVAELKTGRTSYEKTGSKNAAGDDKYDYVPAPDKVEVESTIMLEVTVPEVDLAKLFEAVS